MKKKGITLVALLGFLFLAAVPAGFSLVETIRPSADPHNPQYIGTAISYQGSLQDENGPVDGQCDLQFTLFDAFNGGSQIGGTITKTEIQVSAGYFTVYDLDFGAGTFNGQQRFIEVAVRCPFGSGSYTKLEPRQELTPAPYALAIPGLWSLPVSGTYNLIGGTDGNSIAADVRGGTISGGGTEWQPNHVTDDYGTISGGEGNQTGNDDLITDNAEHSTVGGGLGNAAVATNSTVAGGVHNLAGGISATVGGGGENKVTGEYNATIAGGYDNQVSASDATIGGGQLNRGNEWAVTISGGYINEANGPASTISGGQENITDGERSVIGGGTGNNAQGEHSTISGGNNHITEGDFGTISGGEGHLTHGAYATVGGGQNNQVYASYGTIGGGGSESSNNANIIELNAHWATISGGDHHNISGAFGTIGGGYYNSVSKEHGTVSGGALNHASGSAAAVPGGTNNSAQGQNSFAAGTNALAQHKGSFVWSDSQPSIFASGADNQFAVRATGGVYFATGDAEVSVNVLEIRGGSDLAEPFTISGMDEILPGTVVSIDPDNPGNLQVSSTAYDRLVAGCVSGANGVNPGLIMQQEGSEAAGSVPVALSGRVYCLADAATGPINPGDLLTTAPLPGHLTAVSDFQQAQGAIVGKAMSGLESGQGYVLVLVSLQ